MRQSQSASNSFEGKLRQWAALVLSSESSMVDSKPGAAKIIMYYKFCYYWKLKAVPRVKYKTYSKYILT